VWSTFADEIRIFKLKVCKSGLPEKVALSYLSESGKREPYGRKKKTEPDDDKCQYEFPNESEPFLIRDTGNRQYSHKYS
jgi:hypothetical protein